MIYFIRCKEVSYVKIGYTGVYDVKIRFSQLQTACPLELELIKTIDGGRDYEKAFHRVFKEFHVRGEWLVINEKLMQFINGTAEGYGDVSKAEIKRIMRTTKVTREKEKQKDKIKRVRDRLGLSPIKSST